MKLLKPGDPCPNCGTPIREGLPVEAMLLLSLLAERKVLPETAGPKGPWQDWLQTRFERSE